MSNVERAGSTVSDVGLVLAAIDELGQRLVMRDLERTMTLLAEAEDVTVIPSEGVDVFRGRSALDAFFRRIYAGPRRYGWRWRDRWVSIHGGSASFVAVGTETVDVSGEDRVEIPYCLTGTLVLQDGSWRFTLLHGSEASAEAVRAGSADPARDMS